MRRQAHREKCIFKFKGLNGKYICSILWSLGYISKTIILLHYKYFKSNTLQVKKLKKGYCPFCCHRFIKNNCTNGHGRLPPFHGNKSLFRNYKRTWPIFIRNSHIWPPPVAIFLALWVWEGTGSIQDDKYLKW